MLNKLKTSANTIACKMNPKKAMASAYLAMVAMNMSAAAGTTANNVTLNDLSTLSAETMVAKLIGTILDIFRWIGVLLLVWAIGQVIMAFKNEDADSKSRAMMIAIVAIVLITLKTVLKAIGIVA